MKRFDIIQEIIQFHPSMGVEWGLSTYTGGMKDSGYWFEGRLIGLKKKELRAILKKLKSCSSDAKPAEKYTGEVVHLNNGMWYYEQERRAREEFEKGFERYWLNFN